MTTQLSNATFDRMFEEAHRAQRLADVLTADLSKCKSVAERKATLETIARMTLAARASRQEVAHAS